MLILGAASRGMSPGSVFSAASRDLLNPLPPPGWRLDGIPEILCFAKDFAVAELHDTHRVRQSLLASDCVFGDPQIPVSENALDLEAGRFAGMMVPQGLQIASPDWGKLQMASSS